MEMVVSEFGDPRAFEPMIATLAVAMGSVRGPAAIGDPAVLFATRGSDRSGE
jgi:hypothetical protein